MPERIDTRDYGGDREDLALKASDRALVEAVAAENPKTIVVLIGGSAITVEEWEQKAPAIVMAFYPGEQGGAALARILLGDVNPSGKLPFTVPRDRVAAAGVRQPVPDGRVRLLPRLHARREEGQRAALRLRPRARLHDLRVREPVPRQKGDPGIRGRDRVRRRDEHGKPRGRGDRPALRGLLRIEGRPAAEAAARLREAGARARRDEADQHAGEGRRSRLLRHAARRAGSSRGCRTRCWSARRRDAPTC